MVLSVPAFLVYHQKHSKKLVSTALGHFSFVLLLFLLSLCFAEVSSRFDKTGGPYLYALSSFGPLPAFLTGWLLLVTRFITYAALINLLVLISLFFLIGSNYDLHVSAQLYYSLFFLLMLIISV